MVMTTSLRFQSKFVIRKQRHPRAHKTESNEGRYFITFSFAILRPDGKCKYLTQKTENFEKA